jgi:hypothetical protein
MLSLALGVAILASRTDAALAACRPALARKAGGDIAEIAVATSSVSGKQRIIRGPMTVFIGMAKAPTGQASTHHLIRANYHYSCWTRHGAVVRTKLTQP